MRVLWFVFVNIDALHSHPLGLMRAAHSDHLHLAVDRSAKGSSGDRQVHVRVDVLKANPRVLPPIIARANHLPMIASVSFALFVAIARDLLVSGQGAREKVRMQVLVRRRMVQPDDVATGNWLAAFTELS